MSHLTGTTSPDATSVLTTWLNKNFVRDLEWTLQHQKFTTKAVIPKGAGNKGRFLTFAAPTAPNSYSGGGPSAITEGSTTANEITAITQTSTDITIGEFGEFTKVGTLYEYASVPGLRQELLKRLRDGAAFSIDKFVLSKARTTTSIYYADATPAGLTATGPATSATTLGAASLVSARKVLFSNLAKGFEGIEGVPRGHYAAVITPDQEQDIVTEYTTQRICWNQSVVNVPGAMGQEKFVNGYIGSIYQVAVFATNNYITYTYSAASHETAIVYADGGVGAMAFQDMNPEIILNDLNSPYKNMNTFAWHCNFGAGLIDSARVIKLYSLT